MESQRQGELGLEASFVRIKQFRGILLWPRPRKITKTLTQRAQNNLLCEKRNCKVNLMSPRKRAKSRNAYQG